MAAQVSFADSTHLVVASLGDSWCDRLMGGKLSEQAPTEGSLNGRRILRLKTAFAKVFQELYLKGRFLSETYFHLAIGLALSAGCHPRCKEGVN
jgi:hypothetical protein